LNVVVQGGFLWLRDAAEKLFRYGVARNQVAKFLHRPSELINVTKLNIHVVTGVIWSWGYLNERLVESWLSTRFKVNDSTTTRR
jgi:hypothetical protein